MDQSWDLPLLTSNLWVIWAGYLACLSLSFLICKMGLTDVTHNARYFLFGRNLFPPFPDVSSLAYLENCSCLTLHAAALLQLFIRITVTSIIPYPQWWVCNPDSDTIRIFSRFLQVGDQVLFSLGHEFYDCKAGLSAAILLATWRMSFWIQHNKESSSSSPGGQAPTLWLCSGSSSLCLCSYFSSKDFFLFLELVLVGFLWVATNTAQLIQSLLLGLLLLSFLSSEIPTTHLPILLLHPLEIVLSFSFSWFPPPSLALDSLYASGC